MKPVVWHLTCRSPGDWHLELRGGLQVRFDHEDDAIREAARRSRDANALLVIHRADGSVGRKLRFGTSAPRSG